MLKLPQVKNPHFYVFGTGGTGGFAVEYLSRLFAKSSQRVTIELFDGDTVEMKNLKRQNFTMDDLDEKKTSALLKRLKSQVMNPPKFVEHTEYITDEDELLSEILLNTEDDETPILISAVDNIATRRLINKVIKELHDTFPVIGIDSGNDDQGGQVVLFANCKVNDVNLLGSSKKVILPNMLELYPEIDVIKDDRDKNPGIVSVCAEESESKPQAMLANVRNGEVIAGIAYQVSQNQGFTGNVWHSSVLNQSTTMEMKGVKSNE